MTKSARTLAVVAIALVAGVTLVARNGPNCSAEKVNETSEEESTDKDTVKAAPELVPRKSVEKPAPPIDADALKVLKVSDYVVLTGQ